MKKINLAISGCLGRMGQQLIKSSKSNKNFKLVALTENKIINKKIDVRNLKLLDFSIIIVHNWYIKQLLNGIFEIQKPVSTVYIVEKTNLQLNELIQDIHSNNVKDKIDKINKIIIKK